MDVNFWLRSKAVRYRDAILACSGYYNKIPQLGSSYPVKIDFSFISLIYLFLEAGSPRSECQRGQVPVRALHRVTDRQLLLVSSRGRKREVELSKVSFLRAPIPFMRTAPL